MEQGILSILPQLGVGVVAIIGLVYVACKFMDIIARRDKVFMDFVNNNNHKVTDQVTKATAAIDKSTNAIEASGEFMKEAAGVMKEVRDYFIKQNKK